MNPLLKNLQIQDKYVDTPYGAFDSDYPYLDSENKSLILKPENFAKSWEQYGFSGYNDERVKLVSAVALKFQRVGRTVDTDYSFKIKKIKYNLAQLPSFRFMPRDDSFALIVFNEDGGRVVVDGLKGIVDGDNPKIVRYPLWEAKYLSFKVFISSGYELSEVSYSTISDNPLFRLPLYPSVYSNFFVKTEMIESENKYSVSNFFVGQDIYLYVKYKPCSRKQHLVTPFYTKNEKFLKPGGDAANATISAVYSDGFGSTAQIQKRVDEKKFSVSSKYKNSFGQVTKNPMAFVRHDDDDDFKYVDVACEQCVVKANEYFVGRDEYVDPNAEGYAYAETNYFNADEGLIFEAAGIAENSFERSRNSSEEKIAKVWKMPAKDNNDYIDFNLLDDVHLAGIYVNRKKEGGQFILNVEKNAQGVFSQKIYNSKGQNETSWTYDGTNVLISYNTFDIYGNVVESGIKGYEKLSTTFKYDAQNRLISSKNSDRGETEIFYDSHGRDRLVRTAQLKAEGEYNYLAKVYDSQGRIVATGISRGFDFKNNFDQKIPEENFKLITRSMYGKLTEDSLTQFGVDYDLAHNLVPFLKDFRSNDESAIIAFDEDQKYTKISIVGYDNLGRVINRWVLYGLEGVPPIQLNFSYNTSDEIVESVFSEWIDGAWVERVKRKRTYDSKGRLEWIYDNDIPLASYTYALNGNVRSKKYYFGKDSYVEKIIHRDVYGRVINIEYVDENEKQIYSTTNDYNTTVSLHADKTSHEWSAVKNYGNEKHENEYTYDYLGRLTSVSGNQPGSYGFDKLGRMRYKTEKQSSVVFKYNEDAYRPSEFEIYEMGSNGPTGSQPKFRYDASGNVWLDEHNLVAYKNNASGLPTRAYKLASIPKDVTLNDVNKGVNLGTVEQEIDMAYDEAGNRIWYSVRNMHDASGYTKVTIPGVGLYSSVRINGVDSKINLERMDLVAGGFRQGFDGNVFVPVTDVQGNVRGYAGDDGLENAFGYYAYGSIDDFAVGSIDGQHRWQSKEFDGEHGKYYFGARFFDPFFGMWMSPDPAGQFVNPYTYGGDPLNFVDPNGEEVATATVVIGAIVGAVIGGSSALYQCSNYGGGSCTKGVTVGAVSGAAAGAVGGYAAAGVAAAGGPIAGGLIGGGAGAGTGYIVGSVLSGSEMSLGEGAHTIMLGTIAGGISAGVAYGWNQIPYFSAWEVGGRAVSSAVGDMSKSLFNGEDLEHIGSAGVKGLVWGGISSEVTAFVSLGLIYGISGVSRLMGGDGVTPLNDFFGTEEGEFMTERKAYEEMRETPGMVSASVNNSLVGWFIMLLSGGGPFTHVRASDADGKIIEANKDGIFELGDGEGQYPIKDGRITFVTKAYVGGQTSGMRVGNAIKKYGKGFGAYRDAGLCVGASAKVNPAYTPRSPNGLFPWGLKNTYLYY